MNINKAIEIKGRTGEEFLKTDPDDIDEADRLSIEALIAFRTVRQGYQWNFSLPLVGETKD